MKSKWLERILVAIIIVLVVGLCLPLSLHFSTQFLAQAASNEVISKRNQTSKVYDLGNGKYAVDCSINAVHYKDANDNWQNINLQIINGVMNQAGYTFRLRQSTFNEGQIVEFSVNDSYIRFQPMALEYSNALSQVQQISIPQAVTGTISNNPIQLLPGVNSYQGVVSWQDAYGSNRDFEWALYPTRLTKILTIQSLDDLPTPASYIINGGSPYLRLNIIFAPSSDLEIYIDGTLWDKSATKQTFGRVEFRKDGITLWDFAPQMYWDSAFNDGVSIKTLGKVGNKLYIDVRVPYSWLQTATYPIYIDTTIDTQVAASGDDCQRYTNTTSYFSITSASFDIGYYSSSYKDGSAAARFLVDGSGIPQGATIGVAYLTLTCRVARSNTAVNSRIRVEKSTNSAIFTTVGDFDARVWTTDYVNWDNIAALAANDTINTADFSIALQEAVNQAGWTVNSPIAVLIDDFELRSTQEALTEREFRPYDSSTTACAKIHIEYIEGGVTFIPRVMIW